MKLHRFELPSVIKDGQEKITLPEFAMPFYAQWEKDVVMNPYGCPVVYFGSDLQGQLMEVSIKAISERENRNAPFMSTLGDRYIGVALSPENELFFLFAIVTPKSQDGPKSVHLSEELEVQENSPP